MRIDYLLLKRFGATDTINSGTENVVQRITDETIDRVDVAIEAVGLPATFDICQNIIRPGGNIAVVGVHGGRYHEVIFETSGVSLEDVVSTLKSFPN